ncbi:MAG TPA: DUF5683 domain-containing protein [Mucilaginibacter sp.]|jgi:hypothetical protein|nr:DUF5683 domain-containing protein [Mucilaginibacter sp.]
MYKYLLVIWLAVFSIATVSAQQPDTTPAAAKQAGAKDTLKGKRQDTLNIKSPKVKKEKVYHPDSLHSPHKAVIHSLIVPGWGQIYNHQWWKVPVIYGGLGLLMDAIIFNNTYYKEFLQLSKYREYGVTPTPGMPYYADAILYQQQPDQAIYDANDGYRRNRDLCILGFAGAWGIQCIDAYIDAKFIHSYTVDDNLTMKIEPGVMNQPSLFAQTSTSSIIPGLKITFTFGK